MRKKDVLTTGQVAQMCNVAPRTVSKWFDSGQLKGYRIPGSKDRRIPLSELLQFMKAHDIPVSNLKNDKLRILIIDNRVDYSHHLSDAIQMKGSFEVRCANNIFEAGLLALKFSPNVILVDLMSSEIDAQQICSYVQKTEELQHCAMVALAGGLSVTEADNLRVYGFDKIIVNSCDITSIVEAIEETALVMH